MKYDPEKVGMNLAIEIENKENNMVLNYYYDAKSNKVDPRWSCIEVSFVEKFKNVITLPLLRENKKLRGMLILRPGNRLSVTPVEMSEYLEIKKHS